MSEPLTAGATGIAGALRRWLFSGACQSESGAFCAWRDADTGELAFEYPEITGYLLTFAASLDDLAEQETAAARRAADWLVSRLGRGDYSAREGWDGGAVYTFDLAMLATGLLAFGRRFGDEYVEAGAGVVDVLCAEADAAGRVPAVARGPASAHTGWATEGRAHLLKAVQCLLLAAELGVRETRELAQALIGEAAELQCPDGRFVTNLGDEITMLHPHHYAVEGLWMWGNATSDAGALDQARRGLEWAFSQQLATGGFPRFAPTKGEPGPEQGDTTAQAVRMACLLEFDLLGLDRAVARLAELTIGDECRRSVVYQPTAESQHENAWTTLFAAQALAQAGREPPRVEWDMLV